MVTFKETPVFTGQIIELISDDEYAALQRLLVRCPTAGKVIQGSGGIRKIRWMSGGKDKRGGIRVLYYWVTSESEI